MKYPNIIFFRYLKYKYIDDFLNKNKDKLLCNLNFTEDKFFLNNLFDTNYHLLITFGDNEDEYHNDIYSILPERIHKRWIHYKNIDDIDTFNNSVNYCYISNVSSNHTLTRPIFSIFTTCYNSYKKIYRAYNSLKLQTLKDWEWVIMDDSPDDEHFNFLRKLTCDKRIRLYKRSENSGNIGNVKNEVVSLCRGKYVLELDHDDEILPNTLFDSTTIFEKDIDIGFIYMDFINIYENGSNFNYGNFYAYGYGGYYMQKYNNRWAYVSCTPNINSTVLMHIVSVPNHPRIWRRDTLLKIGNYSEFLPICDDYELLLRTSVNTKMVKIHQFGYIQYMNDNGNNFSYIRNAEINRLTPNHIRPQCYNDYKIIDKMKELDGYEDEEYSYNHSQVWKRKNYTYKYINDIVNLHYKKIYCIIGYKTLLNNLEKLNKLYSEKENDFLVLDNSITVDELCNYLDQNNFDKMKCYAMNDCTNEELINYFHCVYKSTDEYEIIL